MDVQVTVDAEHLPTLGAAVYLRMYVWSDTLYKGRVHTNVCTYERARSQKYLESVYHSAKISSTHTSTFLLESLVYPMNGIG